MDFANISLASHLVDQTGGSLFWFVHGQPLCSYLSKESGLYQWLMPKDPRTIIVDSNEVESETAAASNNTNKTLDEQQLYLTDDAQYSLGDGSYTSFGLHHHCVVIDCFFFICIAGMQCHFLSKTRRLIVSIQQNNTNLKQWYDVSAILWLKFA